MARRLTRRTDAGQVELVFTDRTDGDLAVSSRDVATRRRALDPRPWTWLRQVHGAEVVHVEAPGAGAGREADASVTDVDDAVLAVQGADCAPLLFWSPEGPVAAAHAGWRGIERGVVAATADAMRALGARTVHVAIGACIHPRHYEFGATDLERLAARFGTRVRSVTAQGAPALDVPTMLRVAIDEAGVRVDHDVDVCTAGSPVHFSHRMRSDTGRHAGYVVRTGVGS